MDFEIATDVLGEKRRNTEKCCATVMRESSLMRLCEIPNIINNSFIDDHFLFKEESDLIACPCLQRRHFGNSGSPFLFSTKGEHICHEICVYTATTLLLRLTFSLLDTLFKLLKTNRTTSRTLFHDHSFYLF